MNCQLEEISFFRKKCNDKATVFLILKKKKGNYITNVAICDLHWKKSQEDESTLKYEYMFITEEKYMKYLTLL